MCFLILYIIFLNPIKTMVWPIVQYVPFNLECLNSLAFPFWYYVWISELSQNNELRRQRTNMSTSLPTHGITVTVCKYQIDQGKTSYSQIWDNLSNIKNDWNNLLLKDNFYQSSSCSNTANVTYNKKWGFVSAWYTNIIVKKGNFRRKMVDR